jgi:cation:H+ antiporter
MEVAKVSLFLLGGGGVLSWGANMFVASASHLARRFGIPPVIIGLTVVAFGTSAPELAVNIMAALQGNTDIAMGNVVGSNIFNIAFILGICTLIKPLFVSSQLIRIDIPIMIGASLLLFFMAQNNHISFTEGGILVAGIILYNLLQVFLAVKGKDADTEFEKEYSDPGRNLGKDILILVVGLALLVVGANYFVEGAVLGARLLGWSEAVIGLTIIAAGTSLPEVATSVTATIKGERDIAIGNVVGSNVFNILGVIGLTSMVAPKGLPVNQHMAGIDIPFMFAIGFICLPFCIWRKQLDRMLGVLLFSSWIGYTYYLIMQS